MWAAQVRTVLNDGRDICKQYIYVKGHPKNPLADEDLINKLKKCASYSAFRLNDEVTGSLSQTILNLEGCRDVVSDMILPLTPS